MTDLQTCTINEHAPTDDGQRCECGYFIQTPQMSIYSRLNAKHQDLINYLKDNESLQVTLRDIVKDTAIESIGSAAWAIDSLIGKGIIEQTARSTYKVNPSQEEAGL